MSWKRRGTIRPEPQERKDSPPLNRARPNKSTPKDR